MARPTYSNAKLQQCQGTSTTSNRNAWRQQRQAPPVVAAAKARLSGQRRWKAAATCFGGFFLTTCQHSVELQQPLSHIWRNKLPGRARNGKRQLTQALLQQQGCHGKSIIWQRSECGWKKKEQQSTRWN